MLKRKIDSWQNFCIALLVFWGILGLAEIFFTGLAGLNMRLTAAAAQAGYLSAMRGVCLLFALAAALAMAALLRRGLILAPLIWVLYCLRFTLAGPWREMMKNVLFVSGLFNLLVLLLTPVVLGLLLWLALEYLDPQLWAGRLLFPGLWTFLALTVFAGSYFSWHWSQALGLGWRPWGFPLLYLILGFLLAPLVSGKSPWPSSAAYLLGIALPPGVLFLAGGWSGGPETLLALFLPFSGTQFAAVWLELLLMIAAPPLAALLANQYYTWRRGGELIKLF